MRAISVVAVLLFHFKVPGADGGFAGVDVFFVISGFLMTEIVLGRQEQGRFSILQFWAARARRIVPALVFVVLSWLAWAYFFVDAIVFEQIAREASPALLFISNITLWRNVGYFDARADEKWFLHTWSLSLEWQFYLLFPFAMILLSWLFPELKRKFAAFLFATIAAFAIGVIYQYVSHASTFYLLPFRAWELMAGGLVAFLNRLYTPPEMLRTWLVRAGLAMILVTIVAFNRMTVWPSGVTLLPVLGAVGVLWGDRRQARWADNPVMSVLGQWSYSIYLWHWPFIVAWAYLEWPMLYALPTFIAMFAGGAVALSFALPQLIAALKPRYLWPAGLVFWFVTLGYAGAVERLQGLPGRHPSDEAYLAKLRSASADWGFPPNCNGLDKAGQPKLCGFNHDQPGRPVIFLGDSHSSLWYNRFSNRAETAQFGPIVFMTAAACPPLKGLGRAEQHVRCDGFFDAAMREIERMKPRRLIISSIWTTYAQFGGNDRICFTQEDGICVVPENPEAFRIAMDRAFDRTAPLLERLREGGTELVILLPLPIHKKDIPKALARRDFLNVPKDKIATIDEKNFRAKNAFVLDRLRQFASRVGARLVDPAENLCENGICSTVDRDGRPLYMDSNHLTSQALKLQRFGFVDRFVSP